MVYFDGTNLLFGNLSYKKKRLFKLSIRMKKKEGKRLYLFCGGKSRRMGFDKALVKVNGKTLLEYQLNRSAPHFDEIVLLSGANKYEVQLRQLPDYMNNTGPLAGLCSALHDAAQKNETEIVLLPVDLPAVSVSTLKILSSEALQDKNDAFLLKSGEQIQPLAGMYRSDILNQLEEFLNSGQRMVMKFLERLNTSYLEVDEKELRNINYPGELRDFLRE